MLPRGFDFANAKSRIEEKMKKDWEIKKLGDVGTFIRGGNFSKKDFVEKGFPCIHYGQIHMKFGIETLEHISSVPSEMVKPDRCAKKGDLVIAITSEDDAGSCKCTAWMGDYDAYVGGHTAIYRHTMQPKFVSYYFNSPQFQKAKLEFTHGFKVVEINPKDIAKIAIPVPPLEEQKRIVKILDEKFEQLETIKTNAQTNLQNAKDLFQSQLTKAFSNTAWEKKRLGEICDTCLGKMLDKNKNKGTPQPYLANINVRWGCFDLGNLSLMKFEDDENERYGLRNGDLIICEGGEPGRCAIWNDEIPNMKIQKALHRVRCHNNLSNYYLYYWFVYASNANKLGEYFTGTTIKHLPGEKLKSLQIPLPPLSEQKRIVKELDTLSEKVKALQNIYEQMLLDCEELKQSILQKAFDAGL